MLWQLKKLSTNEALNEAGPLPNNWGPIFGMAGIEEKLSDLSWLGDSYTDIGWVQVEGTADDAALGSEKTLAQKVWAQAKNLLWRSDWAMLPDVPLTVEEKQKWIEYRKALRDIRSQQGFPEKVTWPTIPE